MLMQVDVVSAEGHIFSGQASFLVASGVNGELGIYPRHIPLLTKIKPGILRLTIPNQVEEMTIAVSGGILEVQPDHVTVLADTAVRSESLDAERASLARKEAEKSLADLQASGGDEQALANAHAALAAAMAELKTVEFLRRRANRS
jgi:F-type H+-transporting ATPase subunit epsilon